MSSTVSFQTGAAGGKPVIFWEEQAMRRQKHKKFNYKEKQQKYPIRKLEPDPPPQPKNKTKKAPSKKVTFDAKSKIDNKRTGSAKSDPSKNKNGEKEVNKKEYVTLTQNQFNKILETIGELTMIQEQETAALTAKASRTDDTDASNLRLGSIYDRPPDPIKPTSDPPGLRTSTFDPSSVPGLGGPVDRSTVPGLGPEASPGGPVNRSKVPGLGGGEGEISESITDLLNKQSIDIGASVDIPLPPEPTSYSPRNKAVAPSTVPGLGAQSDNNVKLDISGVQPQAPTQLTPGRAATLGVPRAHLTKAERKRIEWERERAEDILLAEQTKATAAKNAPHASPRQPVPQSNTVSTLESNKATDQAPVTVPSYKPMTKAELKKLQWQQERAEETLVADQAKAVIAKNAAASPRQPVAQTNTVAPDNRFQDHTPVSKPSYQPLTKAELKKLQWQQERAEETLVADQAKAVIAKNAAASPRQPVAQTNTVAPDNRFQDPTPVSKPSYQPLTKAELKKLQWQKERAAEKEDWSPWGKPGAGAPLKDRQGNLLTDYKTRVDGNPEHTTVGAKDQPAVMVNQSQENYSAPPGPGNQNYSVPQTQHTQNYSAPQAPPTLSQQPEFSRTAPVLSSPAQPAAIRSSFTTPGVVADENRHLSEVERQKKEWLAELDRQREEQRQKKLQEKAYYNQTDTWADKFSSPYKPKGLPDQPGVVAPGIGAPGVGAPVGAPIQDNTLNRVNSAPTAPQNQAEPNTHLRGQNLFMDDYMRKELDEKRKRQLEHQEEIRRQIEEKEHAKKLEREKKIMEEIEFELKMQKERDALQKQTDTEQSKVKKTEEAERRKLELLKQAREEARERAERLKQENLMLKLKQGGHDVSHLKAAFDAQYTSPRPGGAGSVLNVAPQYIPGLDPTPRAYDPTPRVDHSYQGVDASLRESGIQSGYPGDGYHGDRVLTPTHVRAASRASERKEFGVQTAHRSDTPDSAEIQYTGPIKEPSKESKVKKQVRVTSGPKRRGKPQKVEQEEVKEVNKPMKNKEKPRWGAKKQTKAKPKSQSEKDPFYEQKRRIAEENRIRRHEELTKGVPKVANRLPEESTVSSRNKSRSPHRDEVRTRTKSRSPSQGRRPSNNAQIGEVESRSRSRSKSRNSDPRGRSPPVPSIQNKLATYDLDRASSPPVPAIKHKSHADYDYDSHARDTHRRGNESRAHSNQGNYSTRSVLRQPEATKYKYGDTGPLEAPVREGEFVPFIRSQTILDPSRADEPLPISREATSVNKARQAYHQEHDPAKYGTTMENYDDNRIQGSIRSQKKDPLMKPDLVTEHPTTRQSRIMQQLSELRRGLIQKQRELEIGMPSADELNMQAR